MILLNLASKNSYHSADSKYENVERQETIVNCTCRNKITEYSFPLMGMSIFIVIRGIKTGHSATLILQLHNAVALLQKLIKLNP